MERATSRYYGILHAKSLRNVGLDYCQKQKHKPIKGTLFDCLSTPTAASHELAMYFNSTSIFPKFMFRRFYSCIYRRLCFCLGAVHVTYACGFETTGLLPRNASPTIAIKWAKWAFAQAQYAIRLEKLGKAPFLKPHRIWSFFICRYGVCM